MALHLHGGAPPSPSNGPAPPPAGACLDTGSAAAGDCTSMQSADPSCASSSAVAKQRCNAYKANFTPKVAATAVTCMMALSSKQVCDPSQADSCAKAALAQSCPDSSVAQLCAIAAAPCKSTPSDCTSMISGLTDAAKQQIAQCVAQGCSAGLYACIQALK